MTTLALNLTFHWFDEILAGRKRIEYRAQSPHWTRLIWRRRDQISHIRFSRGYTAETLTLRVTRIDTGPCPYNGWPGTYYRLHLTDL